MVWKASVRACARCCAQRLCVVVWCAESIRYLSLHDNRYLRYFKGHKNRCACARSSHHSQLTSFAPWFTELCRWRCRQWTILSSLLRWTTPFGYGTFGQTPARCLTCASSDCVAHCLLGRAWCTSRGGLPLRTTRKGESVCVVCAMRVRDACSSSSCLLAGLCSALRQRRTRSSCTTCGPSTRFALLVLFVLLAGSLSTLAMN